MEDFITTLTVIAIVYGVFALSCLTHTMTGMIANVIIKGETFDRKKFTKPLWLCGLTAFIAVVLAVAFSGMGYGARLIAAEFGAEIGEEVTTILASTVSVWLFIRLFIKGFIQSWQKIYSNVRGWLEIKDTTEFDRAVLDTLKVQTTVNADDTRISEG
jgi:hypothetical protein